ncbi:MAG: hypothetical protein ACKVYV_08885 [Limisphaerales bacterium]
MTDRETLLEAAALGALDALSPADRRTLEAALDAAPDVADEARRLADAAALLALAAPPQPLPTAAWARIAAALPTRAPAARVIPFPPILRAWARSGWAVAAGLALGWAAHWWWSGPPAESLWQEQTASIREGPSTDGLPTAASTIPDPAPTAPPASQAGRPAALPPSPGRDTGTLMESRRLQAEVRLLSSRIAELTRQLEEEAILPPATTPLHVFQLSLTNGADNGGLLVLRPQRNAATDPRSDAGSTARLTEALALAVAGAATKAEDAADAERGPLFASDSPVSVVGLVSPETGKGAVVVHFEDDAGVPAGSTITLSQAGGSGAPVAVLASGPSAGSTFVMPFDTAAGASLTGSGAGGFILSIVPPANPPPPTRPPGETPLP